MVPFCITVTPRDVKDQLRGKVFYNLSKVPIFQGARCQVLIGEQASLSVLGDILVSRDPPCKHCPNNSSTDSDSIWEHLLSTCTLLAYFGSKQFIFVCLSQLLSISLYVMHLLLLKGGRFKLPTPDVKL